MPGRIIAGQRFPGDDGAADPRAAAALTAYAARQGSEHAALSALAAARLLVPVVAVLAEEEAGGIPVAEGPARPGPLRRGKLRREKMSEMALPTLIGKDGRPAVPAFTGLESLRRWRPDARPVPVPAVQVWRAGLQEAGAVVIDVAGPVPFVVDGARLAALADGQPAPLPHQDPDLAALARAAVAGEPALAGGELQPGTADCDVTLLLRPAGKAVPADPALQAAVQRCAAAMMTGAGGRLSRGIAVQVWPSPAGGRCP